MTSFAEFREKAHALSAPHMPEFFARRQLDAAQIAALQTRRLRELLACAIERSPFYARRLKGVDPASFELSDLAHVPSISKAELMGELDDVFTDRRLTRALAESAIAATAREPVPVLDAYLVQATGGSSGLRGIYVTDPLAATEVTAGVLRWLLANLALLDPPPTTPLVVAMVAAASPIHATGLSCAMNPRGSGPAEILSIPVTLPLGEVVERLNALRPHLVFGYPTVLARLARERRAGRLAIDPRGVVTSSEMLTPEARAAIRDGFGVPIVDAFGSTEGLMGATDADGDVFAFNTDTCIVELVDSDDRPVPVGTASARALVTNLANRVQPLIRYRLEDRFTRHPDAVAHGHLRATVEGRADEVLRWGALEIHPLVVRAALLKHPEVTDYQVRQTPCGVEVAVVAAALEPSRLEQELAMALAAAGLRRPVVDVARVDALERNPETGKLRRFVPLAR